MKQSSYLNVILAVIALEILVVIFKFPVRNSENLNEPPVIKTEAITTGYRMPNSTLDLDTQTVNVNIVGINITDRSVMPVMLYNQFDNRGERPLKVKVVE